MPAIVAWIIEAGLWLFRSRIGLFILSALAWLGISYGTQKVIVQPAIDLLHSYMTGMSGAGGDVGAAAWAWIGVLHFDVACTMLISAVATKAGVGAAKIALMKAA